MTKPSNSISTFCGTLILTGALLLFPLPSRGRENAPPEPAAAPSQGDRGGTQEAENATNPNKAKDPCKHQEKHGQKPKLKKQCPPEPSSGGVAKGDFNGDGFGDLAVGVPNEDVGTIPNAGAVNVLYGSSRGLAATNNQFWTEDSPGVVGTAEAEDRFGSSLASGDFNGDGFSDLAIGRESEDAVAVDQGAVTVLYGSASGLTATGNQGWAQNSTGILDDAEEDDFFGRVLVWGDFNNDGFGDLAVGVSSEDVGAVENAGAVNVIYGSPSGLTATNNQLWTQDIALGGAFLRAGDNFGRTLAAGDFDKDGNDDLVIGVPFEDVSNFQNAGEVDILYGVVGIGLNSARSQAWTQNSAGIPDTAEASDNFGRALAVGDFSGDGAADLAIGVPFEDVGTIGSAGAVNVIYGTAGNGLTATKSQLWSQNSTGILDACEEGDFFGLALAAGDFNGDGQSDLAVGVPSESVGNISFAGAVNVLYGVRVDVPGFEFAGLIAQNNQLFTQDTSSVLDTAEEGDNFGIALTAWNFGSGTEADLAIGVPFEDVGNIGNAGAVNVLYGDPDRLNAIGDQFWHQDVLGILDQAEADDFFGDALY
jgi:FG-GAP repeat protein